MSRRFRKNKRRRLTLDELNELELVKKEKKKLKKEKIYDKQKHESAEKEKGKIDATQIQNKPQYISKILLKKYEELKNGQVEETKEQNNTLDTYAKFVQMLKEKEKINNKEKEKKKEKERKQEIATKGKKPNLEEKASSSNEESKESWKHLHKCKNDDLLFMNSIIKNMKSHLSVNKNSSSVNNNESTNNRENGKKNTSFRDIKIFEDYNNESYVVNENKVDCFFTFCHNIEPEFLKEYEKEKNKKESKNKEKEEENDKTIQDIFISENLFLSTNIFTKKDNKSDICKYNFSKNEEINPHFFCSYIEKNYVSDYLKFILDTCPRNMIQEDNPYFLENKIKEAVEKYLTNHTNPLSYYYSDLQKYMKDYFGNIEKKESVYIEKNTHTKKEETNKSFVILNHEEMKSYFHYINSYVDVFYSNMNPMNTHYIRMLNTIHFLNHMEKRRSRRKYIQKQLDQVENEGTEIKEDWCDESFARPKVLILCGFRYIAVEYVELMRQILNPKEVRNKNKFKEEYQLDEEEKRDVKQLLTKKKKSIDFINVFRENVDDCFRLGIRLNDPRKKLELYSPFYESDILICSPLGLEIVIKENQNETTSQAKEEDEEEEEESSSEQGDKQISKKNGKKKKHINKTKSGKKKKMYEYDFLSSIELLIIDGIDLIMMQNLSTLKNVLQFINKPLVKWGNININRIPKYLINGCIKNYRQTIITSSIIDTQFISLLESFSNYRSYLKLFLLNSNEDILLYLSNLKIKQYFKKIYCNEICKIEECIINFISSHVMEILSNIQQVIIFLPSQIEDIRINELLKKNDISFKGINEYTDEKKRRKILKWFRLKKIPIMLVTGRFLFYERINIRGANHVIFFSPPKYPFMYFELIKNLNNEDSCSSMCYYTKYHTYELERIIGNQKTKQLIRESSGKVTLFQ